MRSDDKRAWSDFPIKFEGADKACEAPEFPSRYNDNVEEQLALSQSILSISLTLRRISAASSAACPLCERVLTSLQLFLHALIESVAVDEDCFAKCKRLAEYINIHGRKRVKM